MEIRKIAVIILISVMLVSSLPVYDKHISALISVAVTVVVAMHILEFVLESVNAIKSVVSGYVDSDFSVIYKAMGVSLITQFVSDTASDNGNKALANQMQFAGKAAIAVMAMPIFIQVLEIIKKLTE